MRSRRIPTHAPVATKQGISVAAAFSYRHAATLGVADINNIVYNRQCDEQRVKALARATESGLQSRQRVAPEGLSERKAVRSADAPCRTQERSGRGHQETTRPEIGECDVPV